VTAVDDAATASTQELMFATGLDLAEIRQQGLAVSHWLQELAAAGVNLPPIVGLHLSGDVGHLLQAMEILQKAIGPAIYMGGPPACVDPDDGCPDDVDLTNAPCGHLEMHVATADDTARIFQVRDQLKAAAIEEADPAATVDDLRHHLEQIRWYANDLQAGIAWTM